MQTETPKVTPDFPSPPLALPRGAAQILSDARHALMSGDLDLLSRLGDEAQISLSQLESTGFEDIETEQLVAIRTEALANRRLLAAAIRGLRAARQSLKSDPGFTTYNPNGKQEPAGQLSLRPSHRV